MQNSSNDEPHNEKKLLTRATIGVHGSFRPKQFLNDGALLNPKLSETGIFFGMMLVVYLGHT